MLLYQVEMTGDYTPNMMALMSADIIISTPEKWDGISRNWHSRSYVTKVIFLLYAQLTELGIILWFKSCLIFLLAGWSYDFR